MKKNSENRPATRKKRRPAKPARGQAGEGEIRQAKSGTPADQLGLLANSVDELAASLEQLRVAKEERQKQHDLLGRILDTSPEGTVQFNRKGEIVFADRQAEELLGLTKASSGRIYDPPAFQLLDLDGDPLPEKELPFRRVLATGQAVSEARLAVGRPDGRKVIISIIVAPLLDSTGRVEGVVASIEDITARYQAERRLMLQYAVTKALAESGSVSEVISKVLQAICEGVGWEVGGLWQVDREADLLRSGSMWHKADLDAEEITAANRQATFSSGSGLLGRVWATGQAAWVRDAPHDKDFSRGPAFSRAGLRAALAFPLRIGERVTGVVECLSRKIHEQDDDLLQMLDSIGSQIGNFVERRRAEEALLESQRQLQLITDAAPVSIVYVDRDQRYRFANQATVSRRGVPREAVFGKTVREVVGEDVYEVVRGPLERALAGEPVSFEVPAVFEQAGARDMLVSFGPDTDEAGRVRGVVGVMSDITERKRQEESLRDSRDRLARALAELKRRETTQRILAEAGSALVGPFDYPATLENLARLLVPDLADWCAIDVLEEEGPLIRRAAVAHVDPSKMKSATELQERYPPTWDAPRGVPNVLRTGESELYPEITDEMIRAAARDAEHLELIRSLDLRSAIIVPLQARGRTLGAMTFVWAETGRSYGPDDLALAEELGRRATLALDNARLYQEARSLNAELEDRVRRRTADLLATNKMLEEEIAERRRAEQELRLSEERFRTTFAQAAVGMAVTDLTGRFEQVNPAYCAITGYAEDELLATDFPSITHAEDRERNLRLIRRLLVGEIPSFLIEKRYIHKSGAPIWVQNSVSLLRDAGGRPANIVALVEDISERKQVEADLAEVRSRLMEGREEERLQLAQELHDGPVQDLYGATYSLSAMGGVSPGTSGVGQLAEVSETLQQVIRTLRMISGELRPPTLTPFGLEAAIRSHAENLRELHPELRIELELMPDEQRLTEHTRLALFRIYQHSLSNVIRHAEAVRVLVRLILSADQVVLEVRDDGRGFALPERWVELAREGHLGLVGAAERAEAIGGKMEVEAAPGKGTLVRVVATISDRRE